MDFTTQTKELDPILYNLEHSIGQVPLAEEKIIKILNENYASENVFLDFPMSLTVSHSKEKASHYDIESLFICKFDANSTIPEVHWDHVAGSLLTIIANQVGKVGHSSLGDTNGVNLLGFDCRIKKPVPVKDLSVKLTSDMFPKAGLLWAKSKLEFMHNGSIFGTFNCLTHGINRIYKTDSQEERLFFMEQQRKASRL